MLRELKMSYEYNQQELEGILDKCFVSEELRGILAEEGIAGSEPATLSIEWM